MAALAAPAGAAKSAKAPDAPSRKALSEAVRGLEFRSIGPTAGKIDGGHGCPRPAADVLFQRRRRRIWKTVDGGSNWEAMSDKVFKTGSVGSIAVSESDPNVVFAGMGIAHQGNVSHGDGVWKSTDSGHTWRT
jgi:hypothetical protein